MNPKIQFRNQLQCFPDPKERHWNTVFFNLKDGCPIHFTLGANVTNVSTLGPHFEGPRTSTVSILPAVAAGSQ